MDNTKGYVQGALCVLRRFPLNIGPRRDLFAPLLGIQQHTEDLKKTYAAVFDTLRSRHVKVTVMIGSDSGQTEMEMASLVGGIEAVKVAPSCGSNVALGAPHEAAVWLERLISGPSGAGKSPKEAAAEAIFEAQNPPHSTMEIERALQQAMQTGLGGPLVDNLDKMLRLRQMGYAIAADIAEAVDRRDRAALRESVEAGLSMTIGSRLVIAPCLCPECAGWREAIFVGERTLKRWISEAMHMQIVDEIVSGGG